MWTGLTFGGNSNPWVEHRRRPWRSRAFIRAGAVNLVGATAAAPNTPPATAVITFTTDELAVYLASMVMIDNWGGSATMEVYIRSRGAILEEFSQQLTHDLEGGAWPMRLDVLCPPHSQIELSARNLTDSGNDRPVQWWISGWYELSRGARVAPDRIRGEGRA